MIFPNMDKTFSAFQQMHLLMFYLFNLQMQHGGEVVWQTLDDVQQKRQSMDFRHVCWLDVLQPSSSLHHCPTVFFFVSVRRSDLLTSRHSHDFPVDKT